MRSVASFESVTLTRAWLGRSQASSGQTAQCSRESALAVGLEQQPVHVVIDQILDVCRSRSDRGTLHRHVLEQLHGRRIPRPVCGRDGDVHRADVPHDVGM
jgi:hypothetical protein